MKKYIVHSKDRKNIEGERVEVHLQEFDALIDAYKQSEELRIIGQHTDIYILKNIEYKITITESEYREKEYIPNCGCIPACAKNSDCAECNECMENNIPF